MEKLIEEIEQLESEIEALSVLADIGQHKEDIDAVRCAERILHRLYCRAGL